MYAIPSNSDAAKQVKKARIGIVWHTTYKGKTFESMRASYGVDVSKLRSSSKVWSQDAMLRDLSVATLSKSETDEVNDKLSQIGKLFNQISGSTLRELESNQSLAQLIEQFNNTFVRKGQVIGDTRKHTSALLKWVKDKYKTEAQKRKTPKGQRAQIDKLKDILTFFSPTNRSSLEKMFELQKLIVEVKLKLIGKLNKLSSIDTFVRTSKGYKVTGAEGFVAIDKLKGDAVKLVDRMEFSYNNFSPDILKGWQSASRN